MVQEYLYYKGESIDRIGTINEYLGTDPEFNYIEGTLVLLPRKTPIIVNAINAELTQGIYVQKDLFEEVE